MIKNKVYKSKKYIFIFILICFICFFANISCAAEVVQNNVKATSTTGSVTWYSTLSAATSAASDGDIIEVYKSFTETTSVKIQKQNLTIKAADGYNPIISFTNTVSIPITNYTSYHCIVVYTSVTTATTFGGGTGTLTIDASLASDDDNKGTRARVMAHCGSGIFNLYDGIVFKGGKPGGGKYEDSKNDATRPTSEISGSTGNGAGILLNSGTLNMYGGIIEDCYSLWGQTTSHNLVGAGGGICVNKGATLNMHGGIIRRNAAGSRRWRWYINRFRRHFKFNWRNYFRK